jgi:ubiquinone/menaquinone biosynthesis C-methylase UbiE
MWYGPAARLAAERVGLTECIGLDLDPGMLEVGRRCAEQAGRRVDWCCDALMPFDDGVSTSFLLSGLQFSR